MSHLFGMSNHFAMKKALLLIDDSKEQSFLEEQLSENGFSIETETDADRAITRLTNWLPDLVVVDSFVPDIKLNEFLAKAKACCAENTEFLVIPLEETLQLTDANIRISHKSIRPKVLLSLIRNLLNKESVSWVPTLA